MLDFEELHLSRKAFVSAREVVVVFALRIYYRIMRENGYRSTSILGVTSSSVVLYMLCFVLLYYTVEDDVRPRSFREARREERADVRASGPDEERIEASEDTWSTRWEKLDVHKHDGWKSMHEKHHVRLVIPRLTNGKKRKGAADRVLMCVPAKGSSTSFFGAMYVAFLGRNFRNPDRQEDISRISREARPPDDDGCYKDNSGERIWIQV